MGNEMTGGDTIWIKLAQSKEHFIDVFSFEEAWNLFKGIRGKCIEPTILNITYNTLSKLIRALIWLPTKKYDYVYSVSDFYPDLIPAFVYKLKNKQSKWIAAYYLIAPPPFAQNSPYKGLNRIKGILYWLMQRLSLFLVNRYADVVFVTSEPDKAYFPGKKVVVVKGGVDTKDTYNSKEMVKKYDAIFIGRFHYQKGVVELINIWKDVVLMNSNAKLCMIGDGPLLKEVLKKIKEYKLESNIDCVGYKNGNEKNSLIKKSKIVLHPATYDSGGMACAEAMVWGLPAIGFNLPAFETYYAKGMLKSATKGLFVYNILELLHNDNYKEISDIARQYILDEWDWDKQVKRIYDETIQHSI